MQPIKIRILAPIAFVLLFGLPPSAFAQGEGARTYWKAPANTHAAGTFLMFVDGNASGFNPALPVSGAAFASRIYMLNYAAFFNFLGRRNQASVTQPFGTVAATTTGLQPISLDVAAKGRADLAAWWAFNLIGAPAQTLQEYSQWEQRTLLDAQVFVNAPFGEYDEEAFLNVGTNRWTVRFGLPFVQSIGDFTPGRRTTFELVPSVTLFGENDALRGLTIEDGAPVFASRNLSQDPLYKVEGHLTRDITEDLWVSADALYVGGGETSLDGVAQDNSQSSFGVGLTVAYKVSEKVELRALWGDYLTDETDGIDTSMLWLRMTYAWNPTADRLAKQAMAAGRQ
jgi:hypothetical protein